MIHFNISPLETAAPTAAVASNAASPHAFFLPLNRAARRLAVRLFRHNCRTLNADPRGVVCWVLRDVDSYERDGTATGEHRTICDAIAADPDGAAAFAARALGRRVRIERGGL